MLELRACHSLEWPATETPHDPLLLLNQVTGGDHRRISRFDALAMAGAELCRRAAGSLDPRTALYLCCEQPNVHDTAAALHQITRQQAPIKPFQFVNISSNMTGFRVAHLLNIGGPNITMCRSDASLEAALELAHVGAAASGAALVGYVEACAWPLSEHRRRLRLTAQAQLVECSHWLYFERDCAAPCATLEQGLRFADAAAVAARLPGHCLGSERLVTGPGIDRAEARDWSERLGLRGESQSAGAAGHNRGFGAGVLCAFARGGVPGRLLYLERTARGEYYATLVAVPG